MPFIAAALPIITAATAVAGVGLSIYGTMQSAHAASQQAGAQQQIALAQQKQEALRQQQMELDARRRQLEAVRQAQRARAQAIAAANAQGALFGSGLAGGFGQISGYSGTNLLGLSQSLALGRANFDESGVISNARYNYAGASGDLATGQGFSSLGGGLIQSLGPINSLFGGNAYGGGPNPYYQNYGGVTYPVYK